MKNQFSKKQNELLRWIYIRINTIYGGKLDQKEMVIFYPNEYKSIQKLGLVKLSNPFTQLKPKVREWYCLSEKGKEFFKNYIHVQWNSEDQRYVYTSEYNDEIIFDKKYLKND